MVLRTKWGNNFNTEKIWGIEYGVIIDWDYPNNRFKKGEVYWSGWSKYTSQRRMLQALNDIRKSESDKTSRVSYDGGKTWTNIKSLFRPVHINYDWEMKNLDEQSLREYKISLLLNKNEDLLC